MDKELYDLLDNMTAEELMPADELLEELAENTALPEDMSSRIRASVLRKAGFKMDKTIRMNKGKDNENITDSGELNTVRRGPHILAACAALAVMAAAGAGLIFGGRLNTAKPGSEIEDITAATEITEVTEITEIIDDTDISETEAAEKEMLTVPEIKGLTEEEAEKALADAGFVPVIRKVCYNTPEGEAISTSPMAGEQAEKGSEVECFISLGYLNDESIIPGVYALGEEEAEQKIREAGFVPEKVEVFSAYYLKGEVCDQEQDFNFDYTPLPGSTVKYYVSTGELQPDSYDDMPEFNKVVYEDDELKVTADRLLCDDNYFIMHLKEETKDGSPISEYQKKWCERLRFADDGEIVAYIKGFKEEIYAEDSPVGGAYLSWAKDFMTEGRELTFDLVNLEGKGEYKSDNNDNVTRESFNLDTNMPTRTLNSENGFTLSLSPMGISWSDDEKWVKKADDARDPFLECGITSGIYIITKDGQRIKELDFYKSTSFGVGTGSVNGDCFYAYRDIDDIDAVELGGVIFR